MKVLLQRVQHASVKVNGQVVGSCNHGLLLFVGFTHTDDVPTIQSMTNKVIHLRIFNDEQGKMNRSILDVKGNILSISQFTLYADASKGRRPSFTNAMKQDEANKLYQLFNQELRKYEIDVQEGIFGADMKVELLNDGPVTMMIDSALDL